MYTYILKDKKLGIYKIGRSADPHSRFRSLCMRGRVVPIALLNNDVEKKLHKEFEENRTEHKEFVGNGSTEWFKRGGKFSKFIDQLEKESLPYITLHSFIEELIAEGALTFSDASTSWEIDNMVYGYHTIGIKLLYMVGKLGLVNDRPVDIDVKGISIIKGKIAISEELIAKLKKGYKFFIASDYDKKVIFDKKTKSKTQAKVCKLSLKEKHLSLDAFLLINKVL
jgi:hypothetical protein